MAQLEEEQATREVRTTDDQVGSTRVQRQTVSESASVPGNIIIKRVIWYVAGFIIVLLALRVILFMLGANQGSPFVDFIYSFSGLFAAPFSGILPAPTYGEFGIDSASIVAMIVYALVAWGIAKLIMLGANNPEA
ncbi:YggT family protein [Candidatus Saccharibacteria bacterium]|nr:YggT family protein [Candidatus Saccharibacteria bacterium]NCU40924.1 YggT family protein [Candidatus Saccharibacteria bacterium]